MSPETIAWIVAVVAGSIVSKVGGLALRGRDVGMVTGPLLGVVGAVGLWAAVTASGMADAGNLVGAGAAGAVGGGVLYGLAALLKARRARS